MLQVGSDLNLIVGSLTWLKIVGLSKNPKASGRDALRKGLKCTQKITSLFQLVKSMVRAIPAHLQG